MTDMEQNYLFLFETAEKNHPGIYLSSRQPKKKMLDGSKDMIIMMIQ